MNRFLLWLMVFFSVTAFGQTVLDGDKISRVAGERNYILNPDARQNHTSNVTYSSVTASRSTTTPVGEMGTEFGLNMASNGTATWTVGTLSQGLRGGQCEARAKYRGASATTLFQVRDGANVIAQVAATVDANNSSQLSLPFPCGTALNAFTFRVSAGTTAATAFEIADIYVGQVKAFGDAANITAWQSYTPTTQGFGTITSSSFSRRRVGDTQELQFTFLVGTSTPVQPIIFLGDGLTVGASAALAPSPLGNCVVGRAGANIVKRFVITGQVNETGLSFAYDDRVLAASPLSNWTSTSSEVSSGERISCNARVPISQWSSVNAAVSPGSQNVWGGVKFTGSNLQSVTSSTWTTFNNAALSSVSLTGTAQIASSTCGLSANDLGVCFANVPAGSYRLSFNGPLRVTFLTALTQCNFSILDSLGNRVSGATATAGLSGSFDNTTSLDGFVTIPSFQANYGFRVQAVREAGGAGECQHFIGNAANNERQSELKLVRLDSQNTQPIFITSPVRAAGTGVAPLAGEVGYRPTEASGSSSTMNVATNLTSIVLTPGNYFLFLQVTSNSNTTAASDYLEAAITTSSTPSTSGTLAQNKMWGTVGISGRGSLSWMFPINVTSTTTYYLHGILATGGTGSLEGRIRPVLNFDR